MRDQRFCLLSVIIIFENRFLLLPHFFLYFILCLCINFTSFSLPLLSRVNISSEICAAVQQSEDSLPTDTMYSSLFKEKVFQSSDFFLATYFQFHYCCLPTIFVSIRTPFAIRVATRTKCKICLPLRIKFIQA